VLKGDGKLISIRYLVDLEHDRRKPSDRLLEQLATALKTESDIFYHLAGRIPPDLTPSVVS
jgi:transcriptional regulator with XRE-family HTH domain